MARTVCSVCMAGYGERRAAATNPLATWVAVVVGLCGGVWDGLGRVSVVAINQSCP